MSAQAAARRRAAKRDPYRASQIAPAHPMPPVVCATCGHPRLIHRDGGVCLNTSCDCGQYVTEEQS